MARTTSKSWLRFTAACFAIAMLLSILLSFFGYNVALLPNDKAMTFTWYVIGAFAVLMLATFAGSKNLDARTKGTMLPIIVWLLAFVLNGLRRGEYEIVLIFVSLVLPAVSSYYAFRKTRNSDSGGTAHIENR